MTRKHLILMLLCCLIPVGLIIATLFLKVPVNTVFLVGMVVLCPLLHVVMMVFMRDAHQHDTGPDRMQIPRRLPDTKSDL